MLRIKSTIYLTGQVNYKSTIISPTIATCPAQTEGSQERIPLWETISQILIRHPSKAGVNADGSLTRFARFFPVQPIQPIQPIHSTNH